MSKDNNEFLTSKTLETPAGREVTQAFSDTLVQTLDIQKSVERAQQVAKGNGTLIPIELSLIIDFLTKIAPLLIQSLQHWKSK